MRNPRMNLERYAKRWLKKHAFDPELFAKQVCYIDPDFDHGTAKTLLIEVAKTVTDTSYVQTEIFQDLAEQPVIPFCRQRECNDNIDATERREHQGGAPGTSWENGQEISVVEFDYDRIDGVSPEQRAENVSALEMVFWISEPITNENVTFATAKLREIKLTVLRLIFCPDLLGNPTYEVLGAMLGVRRQTICKVVRDFADRYGVITPFLRSEKAREAYREAQLARKDHIQSKDQKVKQPSSQIQLDLSPGYINHSLLAWERCGRIFS